MDFYELKNKYFSLVRKKMINDYTGTPLCP